MDKNILVIADSHLPFEHRDYLAFCKRIHKAFKCSQVVHIGDLVDNNAISYHENDPDGLSPEDEMKEADKHLKAWFEAFPKVSLCRGNHDRLVDRKSRTAGLPKRCFSPFREIWNLPKGWVDEFEFIIDNVKYIHGTGYSGKYPHVQASYDNRMSIVMGHCHSVAGYEYIANSKNIIFGMSVGSGIDKKTYAFNYGRDFKRKPIVSCAVVSYTKRGINPSIYPMELL